MKTQLTRCLLLTLAGTSLAFAQTRVVPNEVDATTGTTAGESTDLKTGADSLPRGDLRFFRQAARLNEKELHLSRLAAERATDPQVRSFAAEMVREHTGAGEELTTLATRKGARLEMRDVEEKQKEEKKWADKKADDFDEDYLEAMIEAHKETIEALENGAESKDTQIAALAQKLLPKVQAHLKHAQELEKTIDD